MFEAIGFEEVSHAYVTTPSEEKTEMTKLTLNEMKNVRGGGPLCTAWLVGCAIMGIGKVDCYWSMPLDVLMDCEVKKR